MAGAEQIAADRAGGVAVARVVDREQQRLAGLAGLRQGQGAVHGDGQGFLGHPARSERLHLLCARRALRGQLDGAAQGGGRLLVPGVAGQQVHGPQDGSGQGVALQQMGDDRRERAGGVGAGGVAVGDLRAPGGESEAAGRVPAGEAEGRGAHDRAAALGVGVDGARLADRTSRVGDVPSREAGQAGVSGGPACVQPGLLPEPSAADGVLCVAGRRRGMVLGVQPAQVGVLDDRRLGAADPPGHGPGVRPDQPLGREEGHLGVVRDASDDPVLVGGEPPHALFPVRPADTGERQELHRVAQGVPDRTAQQTPADPGPANCCVPPCCAVHGRPPTLFRRNTALAPSRVHAGRRGDGHAYR